jgi:hypothetical protein
LTKSITSIATSIEESTVKRVWVPKTLVFFSLHAQYDALEKLLKDMANTLRGRNGKMVDIFEAYVAKLVLGIEAP